MTRKKTHKPVNSERLLHTVYPKLVGFPRLYTPTPRGSCIAWRQSRPGYLRDSRQTPTPSAPLLSV